MRLDGISNQPGSCLQYGAVITRPDAVFKDAPGPGERISSLFDLEDTINVVSLLNYLNRLVDAFGVEGNPDYFKMVGASLARNGYAALIP